MTVEGLFSSVFGSSIVRFSMVFLAFSKELTEKSRESSTLERFLTEVSKSVYRVVFESFGKSFSANFIEKAKNVYIIENN